VLTCTRVANNMVCGKRKNDRIIFTLECKRGTSGDRRT
jgi:hypothetical protein